MLVRRVARALFATWFAAEGLDAVRRPGPHVARTQACWRSLPAAFALPSTPSEGQLRSLVQAHGAATLTAAAMLALGRAPRTAALALAALTVPLVVVNQPFGLPARVVAAASGNAESSADARRIARPVTSGTVSVDDERAAVRERFLRDLTLLGGALLAAVDREGRPGLGWRLSHARVDRAAALEARRAVAEAGREARAALRAARRAG